MTIEKLMAQINAVEPGRFDCALRDIVAICNACGGCAVEAGSKCFDYGFLKGRRAERAEAKKKYMKELERQAPGYGMLLSIIERNMSNEQFIGAMTARAKNLEKLYCGEATE